MNKTINENEYKVLARKFRPQTFKDLVGQDILVRILTNSILLNRIAHAYILTGVRGVGKTTTARLIAMSLNCENRSENSCEPCSKCNSCISVREDCNLDVIEMDAASKTGVDDIREIIDNIKYKPVSSKYKIFIIDEVHMLSRNAFNALLKTLEEPPAHVKFIFATTEVKKIPITIISRCQRFDLNRIEVDKLNSHLLKVAEKEKIKINQDALALIVRAADGSMRDALSLLDQAIVNNNDIITSDSIIQMLGLADRGNIFDLMNAIFVGDIIKSLEIYNNIHKAGADIPMIFDEMLNIIHFITQIKIAPDLKKDIHIPELERTKGFEISEKISMSSLGLVWQVLFKGYQELQSGYHLHQLGEMIIIRLIYLYQGPTPDDLLKKIKNENLDQLNKFDKVNNNLNNNKDNNKDNEITNSINNTNELIKDLKPKGVLLIKNFRHFVDLFYQRKEAMFHTYLYNNAKLITFADGNLTINISSIADPHFTRTIAKLVSTWTGRIWQINSSSSNIGKTLYEEDLIEQQKEIEKFKNDPEIKNILDDFPGVKIFSITSIGESDKEKNIINNKVKEK